jgi:Asp-tRNA(Asn)/Glu-tRNA(Gln) amidotransferase A subunit family amidase
MALIGSRLDGIVRGVHRILILICLLGFLTGTSASAQSNAITREDLACASRVLGLVFSEAELDKMLPGVKGQRDTFEALRKLPLSNSVPLTLLFNPLPVGMKPPTGQASRLKIPRPRRVRLPENREDLAFYSIPELAELIRTRKIYSEALTRFFLERMKRVGPRLECFTTITEELALRQARRADAEIAAGKYRGWLHGIPYGAKDLLAVKGIPTTWGAVPYTNQVFDFDATVIARLEKAGAVLVAKTTLGELAMGEVWYGGKTRNPWNLEEGSSGSSAGSCAATAAGLLPFAIGSETYGSLVSPADRCGITALRPTFGRVSRAGAMTLSWSMDKIGPICRTAEDCAIVLAAIQGPDGIDPTVYEAPFAFPPRDFRKLRVGFLQKDFASEKGERAENSAATLDKFRRLGMELIPVELPSFPAGTISFLLSVEGAAAFDDLTRSGRDDLLKQQTAGDWANTFRRRRFVPAVEYLQAQRARYWLIQETAKVFERVDLFLAPSFEGGNLLQGNLTGHPCVVLPNGFTKKGTPTSFCIVGKLFGEAEIIEVARRYQAGTDWHRREPGAMGVKRER